MADGQEAFSLDDVRESFIADITHSIQTIETAMAQASAWSRECGQLRAARVAKALTTAADQGHTMVGTSSLVGVNSLVVTGDTFQRLSTAAELMAIEIVDLAQRLEGLCAGGIRLAGEARMVLELELAKQPAQALAIATQTIHALQVDHLPAVERERLAALLLESDEEELSAHPAAPATSAVRRSAAPASAPTASAAPDPDATVMAGGSEAPGTAIMSPEAHRAAGAGDALFDFTEDEARLEAIEGISVVIIPEDEDTSLLLKPAASPPAGAAAAAAPSTPDAAGEDADGPSAAASIDAETHQIFLQEAYDILEQLDRLCLTWGPATTAEARRLYHTLKGAAATVGEMRICAAAHAVEDRLEYGSLPAADALLAVQARMRESLIDPVNALAAIALGGLDALEQPAAAQPPAGRPQAVPTPALASTAAPSAVPAAAGTQRTDRIVIQTAPHQVSAAGPTLAVAESLGIDAELLEPARDLPAGYAGPEPQRSLRVPAERLDHLLAMAGELLLGRNKVEDRVQSLMTLQQELKTGRARLSGVVDEFQAHHEFPALAFSSEAGALGTGTGSVPGPGGGGAPISRALVSEGATEFGALEFDRYQPLNILTRQLVEVGDDLGEVQAQVQSEIDAFRDEAAGLSRTIGTLQGELTRLRMIPVTNLFDRLRLAARSAGRDSSRQAQVESSGEDVHLDKMISEQIAGPLEHLIRNAFAHGFESPQERVQARKPAQGRLVISARHSNGQVEIAISDDGRGLDLHALRERGVAMGLVTPHSDLDSAAVRDLVFAPGLSTRPVSDRLSGRGIGCDAVRRSVQRLGGSIGVRSQAGQSTTFTITLPLTLAITRVLVVTISGEAYALPLGYIENVLDAGQFTVSDGPTGRRLNLAGVWLPLHALSDAVCPGTAHAPGPMVVCRVGERRTVLIVEKVRLHREVVVHGLGELLSGHPLITGVTIGTGGELVPIIDLPGVVDVLAHGQRVEAIVPVIAASGQARVLYVDDSLSVRKTAERTLRSGGHPVVLAHDGEDALERLREGAIDLVFTDLEMPRLNGLELIRAIRANPRWAGLPVIVVTSRTGEKHRAAALAAGATDFISKPFTAEQLLAVTRSLLH